MSGGLSSCLYHSLECSLQRKFDADARFAGLGQLYLEHERTWNRRLSAFKSVRMGSSFASGAEINILGVLSRQITDPPTLSVPYLARPCLHLPRLFHRTRQTISRLSWTMDHIRWQDPYVIVVHHEVTDPAGLLDSQCQSKVAPHSILPHLIQARGCWSSSLTQHGEESQALISLRQPNLISTTRILPEEDFYYGGRPKSSSLLAVAGGLPVLSKEKNSSGKWDLGNNITHSFPGI